MAIQAQLCTENMGGFLPLCNSQDWNLLDNHNATLSTQHQQQQLLQQIHQQSLFSHDVSSFRNAFALDSMSCFQSQWQEIDRFIASQNERLRVMLQEQRKQQIVGVIKRIESKTSVLMKQKDEEILKAASKTVELENLLKRLEMESQAWQRAAQENEAMVVSLNNTLEEMRERASCCVNNNGAAADDAESCCEGNTMGIVRGGEVEDTGESAATATAGSMVCRSCESRKSCVLFLPCRHLCACKVCDAFLDSCPVCKMPKKGSIEALIF